MKIEKNYCAKLIAYDMDYVGNMVFIANWLLRLGKEMKKNGRLQNKDGKKRYSKRFIARLMK